MYCGYISQDAFRKFISDFYAKQEAILQREFGCKKLTKFNKFKLWLKGIKVEINQLPAWRVEICIYRRGGSRTRHEINGIIY